LVSFSHRADAPTCTDCHGLHAIAKVDNDAQGRELHTRACLKCHDDHELMTKNHVTPVAGETYFRSFHGKNVKLGYPERVAGCADCHGAHEVQKAKDPRSTVNEQNVIKTCRQCHPTAGPAFASYLPHADDKNRSKYPSLYWTRIAMTSLLVGTFGFFWLHSLLWALRAFVERQRMGAKSAEGAPHAPPASPGKAYRRFEAKHIALHLVVIVSFLTLAVTGLPLKFSDAPWGKALMHAIGGAHRAQVVHHGAAAVTLGYFIVALVMSGKFLLSNLHAGKTVLARLLGPESLFPNRRDLSDMGAMFRWFVGRGPKPTFERWTYWEKFDYLAVFWGMFAIGTSGLMLWFPALFSRVVPGWAFNLATIVHSDEALLATGFIFTVHFFNTHLRPEKFPMDTVIFDGRITHEEMVEERADQLRRYEQEGRTESLIAGKPPSIAWALVSRLFGFAAVAIGLSLAVVVIYALVTGAH
jgi:cytochrome b subunit of formate dehydrogenase